MGAVIMENGTKSSTGSTKKNAPTATALGSHRQRPFPSQQQQFLTSAESDVSSSLASVSSIRTGGGNRVAGTGLAFITESSFYKEHCTYFPAMAGWFFFSALLSAYNKFVFGEGHIAFPCPLLLTSIHFLAQWTVSSLLCATCPSFWGAPRITSMSWKEWLLISVPCGLVTSGDIGLSNLSLVTISITFYTMVKAATPVFVLGWAYLFGIEQITWSLVLVVMIIAVGEVLTVAGEVDFKLPGFLMCLAGSVLSGARWTLVQLKLQTMDPPLQTTIATMKLLAPSMFFSMIILSMIIEQPWTKFDHLTFPEAFRVILLGLIGASFAISMILCEFHLIMYASAVILMIGGVIKEMMTIVMGVLVFGDELNRINVMGCVVVFLGVILYKITFHYNKREKEDRLNGSERQAVLPRYEHVPHTESGEDLAHELYGEELGNCYSPSSAAAEHARIEFRRPNDNSLSRDGTMMPVNGIAKNATKIGKASSL